MFGRSRVRAGRSATEVAGLVVWLSLVVPCAVLAQEPGPKEASKPAGLTAEERSRNVESFEFVWQTIRDKHFDPTLGGLDWQAVHDESRPKVEAATTMKDARTVISDAPMPPSNALRDHPRGSL